MPSTLGVQSFEITSQDELVVLPLHWGEFHAHNELGFRRHALFKYKIKSSFIIPYKIPRYVQCSEFRIALDWNIEKPYLPWAHPPWADGACGAPASRATSWLDLPCLYLQTPFGRQASHWTSLHRESSANGTTRLNYSGVVFQSGGACTGSDNCSKSWKTVSETKEKTVGIGASQFKWPSS